MACGRVGVGAARPALSEARAGERMAAGGRMARLYMVARNL